MALVSLHLAYLDNISHPLYILVYFAQQVALHAHLQVIALSVRMDTICSKIFVFLVFLTVLLALAPTAAQVVQLDILISIAQIHV